MPIPLNFSNMTKYQAVPKGEYPVKVAESSYGTSKRASQPKWHAKLVITDGPYVNKVLFLEHSLQEQALWGVARSHEALTGQKITSETGTFAFDAEMYLGREAIAIVDIDDSYDGTPRNRVTALKPLHVTVPA